MAYCSTSDVKTYAGVDSSDDDTLIGNLTTRAQQMIDSYCQRTFEATSDTTRTFDAVADVEDAVLWFMDADLAAITTVTNGDSVVVASNEYVTEPRGTTPYYGLRLLASSGKSWTYTTDPQNAISITGRWAYSVTAPADIVHACIRLATFLYRQKDSGGDSDRMQITADGTRILPAQIPRDIRTILEPYRRRI